MSADVKANIKQYETKYLVTYLRNFYKKYLRKVPSYLIFHLILVGIPSILILSVKNREGGVFMLKTDEIC